MANIHVLAGDGNNVFQAVIHVPVVTGNNLVGVNYRTAMANSGLNTTIMTVGSGSGQITQTERDLLTSGALYETVFFFGNNPNWTTTQRQDAFNAEVTQRTFAAQAFISVALAYFGYTQ